MTGISAAALISPLSALAGSATWDFTTDPTSGANAIQVYQVGFQDSTATSQYWKDSNGNPGGFLGLCWSMGSSSSVILFPDIDSGKLVTSFTLDADLRVGNPYENERAADGFSVSFARTSDPVFASHSTADMAASGQPENGTKTGIVISFDTWSGNTLPDGADIEGIIVRLDNVTLLKYGMPTRNGACNDATSMQTGPRNLDYWNAVVAAGLMPDATFVPDAYSNLCWQHLSVAVDETGAVTVKWKGTTLLDKFATAYFPSAGGLILAGRTGGADEMCHLDNIALTTVATANDTTPPTQPANVRILSPPSASRVELAWDPSTDNSGRVAYDVFRGQTNVANTIQTNYFVDYAPKASSNYTYNVVAKDVSNNRSTPGTLPVTTAAEKLVAGTTKVQIFDGLNGTDYNTYIFSTDFPSNPTRASYTLGLTAGTPNGNAGFANSFGDNLMTLQTGYITPLETGAYDFFIRSDDSSSFWLNTNSATSTDLPSVFDSPVVYEPGCCHAFLEITDANFTAQTTLNPLQLTAGKQYAFMVVMKEGGGGDGVAVAMRKSGDPTPAGNLNPIGGISVWGEGDTTGSALGIVSQPASISTFVNEAATFTVGATNTSYYGTNLWYQWLKNGAPLIGAQSASYNIPVLTAGDNGGQFSVIVGSEGLVTTSAVASLTVAADTKLPTIKSVAQMDNTFTKVLVTFSEPVTSPTATTAGNYSLSGGATVSGAALSADRFTVTLTTSALTIGQAYTLTVNNVQDNASNAIAANSQVQFDAWVQVLSTVNIAYFGNINNTTIDNLENDPRYPNSPDSTFTATNGLMIGSPNGNAGFNDSFGDNYGMRITGTITPPGSGAWNFFIRSDDSSGFWINTSGSSLPNTTNAPTCQEPGCCNAFQEPGATVAQTTSAITLDAGTAYGFVILLKEGGGGDGVALAMRIAGDTTAAGNLPAIMTYGPKVKAASTAPTIVATRSGGNVVLTWTGGGTLQSTPAVKTSGTVWSDVTGAASPYSTPASGVPMFFRVKQ